MSTNTTLPAGYAEDSWWYYAPNKVLPMIYGVLFLVSGSWHLYQNIKFKTWGATALFPIAALVFATGFIIREIGAFHYTDLPYYMASTIALLTAPPLYEAANCFILGRLLFYVPYEMPLQPWRLMGMFGTLEVVTEAININGAAKATAAYGDPGDQVAGRILLDVSLTIQIVTMICFILFALRFEYNCRSAGVFPDKLRRSLRVLYLSCTLIACRTIYRAVEWFEIRHIDPSDPSSFPTVMKQEAYFWVFEATAMLLNTFLLNVFHPTRLLPRSIRIFIAPDGVTEMEGKGMLKKDSRPTWLKWCDPFDLRSIFAPRDLRINLWEEQEVVNRQGGDDRVGNELGEIPWGSSGSSRKDDHDPAGYNNLTDAV
ncbi:putative RTA1 domain protein [Calocera cornea HHB12733]|uniref:Putative RTA1 domain protein n=1 Tax=Calocera cornea HHB12733 TaxID=1353952 RepID=A0A165DZJ8_9BASI|nr:putative RTA1 domain protein [Calocera cornea HHB12733]